ncbi:MAG: type II toxin-antitoxin system RelE/ParE family toxin [Taibaiella sp.]|nr:type II toxin-antitoxin system RelE/ParE family toxin [Taibaiella sp.]
MNKPPVEVIVPTHFEKIVKRLRKRFPKISNLIRELIQTLEQGETPGDQIQGVGYTAYKVRLPNPDAQKGKSGGYRVVYYIKRAGRVILLVVYSKTDQVDISPDEIRVLINQFEGIEE